jgi:hypothetical protein
VDDSTNRTGIESLPGGDNKDAIEGCRFNRTQRRGYGTLCMYEGQGAREGIVIASLEKGRAGPEEMRPLPSLKVFSELCVAPPYTVARNWM